MHLHAELFQAPFSAAGSLPTDIDAGLTHQIAHDQVSMKPVTFSINRPSFRRVDGNEFFLITGLAYSWADGSGAMYGRTRGNKEYANYHRLYTRLRRMLPGVQY